MSERFDPEWLKWAAAESVADEDEEMNVKEAGMSNEGNMGAVMSGSSMAVGSVSGVEAQLAAQRAKAALAEDADYDDFLSRVRGLGAAPRGALFTTDATELWENYLEAAPAADRQQRTCRSCKNFIERFGGLVVLDDVGQQTSAFWVDDAPAGYHRASQVLEKIVRRAKVTGVFLTSEGELGTRLTGPWKHLSAATPAAARWSSPLLGMPLLTAQQKSAERGQEYLMLKRGLEDFSIETTRQAALMLTTESLPRSEKHVELARWLVTLQERIASTKNHQQRDNLLWRAVSTAPAGWPHIRSGLLGTLLEDIAAGMAFEAVKRRFTEKIDPLAYMRPKAAPTSGAIDAAEKLFETMRSSGALKRRFAKLSDVEKIWEPKPPRGTSATTTTTASSPGVFGHLAPKVQRALSGTASMTGAPPVVMTWKKFSETVLPTAEHIDLLVPTGQAPFTAYVTAVDASAPPLFQWDRVEKRNAVSWYVYGTNTPARQWGLVGGEYRKLTAICEQPSMWGDASLTHQGESVCLVIDGARDTREAGLGLFPECLRSEYHGARAVIEAYSRSAQIEGREEAEVCGLRIQKGTPCDQVVRVVSRGTVVTYKIDRWD